MNSEQVQALNRVLAHYGHDDVKHYREAGEPCGHIAESLLTLNHYMQHQSYETNNEPTAGSPIGIVRDHPSHNEELRGKSVVDSGSKMIESRWAKETIGLAAVELNEAYAQFEIDRDGCNIPSPHLHRATARLVEVMKRLGLAEYCELDNEIPF